MTKAAYSPMHPPQKEVSQERMAQILAKHSKPKVEVMPPDDSRSPNRAVDAGAASAENTPALKWERISKHYQRSSCGQYRCRAYRPGEVRVGEHNEPWKYQLEKKVGDLWFYRFGPPFDSWDEARKAAEADARAVK